MNLMLVISYLEPGDIHYSVWLDFEYIPCAGISYDGKTIQIRQLGAKLTRTLKVLRHTKEHANIGEGWVHVFQVEDGDDNA